MTIGAIVPLPTGIDPAAVVTAVGGEAVLVRVVRALLGQSEISQTQCVIVSAALLATEVRECLAGHGLAEVVVTVAPGPGDRWHCVRAGLEYLAREPVPASGVLLHDHRHPLAPAAVTDRIIDGLRRGGEAVMPTVVVTDSVKAVDALGTVRDTVDRHALRAVQFPRGFSVSALSELIGDAPAADFDELDAALRVGMSIVTVEGDDEASRLELPADAGLLAATIADRRSS
jgi:2-C-methyl-D-erythritol 4-phosphate cytidylyltransferase